MRMCAGPHPLRSQQQSWAKTPCSLGLLSGASQDQLLHFPSPPRTAEEPGMWKDAVVEISHLFWPIRWALAAACKSFWGLKSLSTKITVSAAVKFMPTPPENNAKGTWLAVGWLGLDNKDTRLQWYDDKLRSVKTTSLTLQIDTPSPTPGPWSG